MISSFRIYLDNLEEVLEDIIRERLIELWDETQSQNNNRSEMTWCNIESDEERGIQIISPESTKDANTSTINNDLRTITCPSCGQHIQLQDQVNYIKVLMLNFF